MKSRSDFVANSSSTGFIVKAEEGTPEIFKQVKVSWDKFRDRLLFNYMLGDFVEACSTFYSLHSCYWSSEESKHFDIKEHIKIVDDDTFVASFINMKVHKLTLPKSFSHLADELCDTVMAARQFNSNDVFAQPMTNGQYDYKLSNNVVRAKQQISEQLSDIVVEILTDVYKWLKAKLDEQCKSWSFWSAELGDEDGGEADGFAELSKPAVTWYFTESHH